MDSLRALATALDIPERTLRRAADEGLIHGERVSPRRFRTTFREDEYLRGHWPLLRDLREALRTEPAVRLAVLFGSAARGDVHQRSDLDVVVALTDPTRRRVATLNDRLSQKLRRDVQLIPLDDARQSPALMAALTRDGRVLVDRDRAWPALRAEAPAGRDLPDPSVTLADVTDELPDLGTA